MTISNIQDVALDQLHGLSIAVGWPHRAEDWQFLRETGRGIVALDEIGRVLGSAMWFSHDLELATIGMVITSPRLQTQGTAHWLMQRVFSEINVQNYRLNATRAARRLYLSLDFTPEMTVFQCQGIARASAHVGKSEMSQGLRILTAADLPAIIASDASAFGVKRSALIAKLFDRSVVYGLFRDNILEAFSFCRPFGRGHVLGPVVATNDADAVAVIRPHVAEHAGSFLRLDTHFETGDFAAFLSQSGMSVFDTVLTMSRGRRMADFSTEQQNADKTYALASQTLG